MLAVAVEISLTSSNSLTLPHPNQVQVNGIEMQRYTVLFAKNDANSIIPFGVPSVPEPYNAFVGDEFDVRPFVDPTEELPFPNQLCPSWLHDLYVTPSRSSPREREVTGEPSYWRTWHPMV